jgi:hypothetical protein
MVPVWALRRESGRGKRGRAVREAGILDTWIEGLPLVRCVKDALARRVSGFLDGLHRRCTMEGRLFW